MKNNISQQVNQKIDLLSPGLIFNYSLFDDIENKVAVAKAVSKRVLIKKDIKRLSRGEFYKVKISSFGLGEIPLDYKDIIMYEAKKYGGYVSGIGLYNYYGLTTQVPNIFQISIPRNRQQTIKKTIAGQRIILKRTSLEKIDTENIKLYQIIEIIRNIKQIPDSDIKRNVDVIKKEIDKLSEFELKELVSLALSGKSKFVVALLGWLLDSIGKVDTTSLMVKLNPATKYNLNKQLGSISKWKIC